MCAMTAQRILSSYFLKTFLHLNGMGWDGICGYLYVAYTFVLLKLNYNMEEVIGTKGWPVPLRGYWHQG